MEAVIPGEHWLDIGGGDRLIQLFSVEMMFAECALTFSLTESASFCKLLDLFSSLTLQSSGWAAGDGLNEPSSDLHLEARSLDLNFLLLNVS